MDAFEPDIYRCPADALPYGVPVYYFNGLAYMNDVFPYRTSFDAGGYMSSAPNDRPATDEHARSRTMMLQVSYRGPCETLVAILGEPRTGTDPTA